MGESIAPAVPQASYNNQQLPYAAPDIDLGVNWLPVSDITDMQWTSIFELGMMTRPSLMDQGGEQGSSPPRNGRSVAIVPEEAGNYGQGTAWSSVETPSSASATSPHSTSTTRSSARSQQGKLYATSSSARAPAYESNRSPLPHIPGTHPQEAISVELEASTAVNISDLPQSEPSQDGEWSMSVWASTYDTMATEFQRLCSRCEDDNQALFPAKESFPTFAQVNLLVSRFYSRFLPSLPILHETLSNPNDYWILTLAMTTIGCHYTKTKEFDGLVSPMHEVLAKAVSSTQLAWIEPRQQICYIQALLLSQIGLYYYGPPSMRAQAIARRGYLIHCAEAAGLFEPIVSSSSDRDLTQRWRSWIQDETRRRLGYSIWVRILKNVGERTRLIHYSFTRCLIL